MWTVRLLLSMSASQPAQLPDSPADQVVGEPRGCQLLLHLVDSAAATLPESHWQCGLAALLDDLTEAER